jgi:hypothetical protein
MLTAADKTAEWLASTRLSIILFGLLAAAAIPGTLLENRHAYYSHPLFVILLTAFTLHLAYCTARRWRALALSTLAVHLGVLLTMAGALLTGRGYTATVNIYEGADTDRVYRWDLQQDSRFDYRIRIRKINSEYHPAPLQIGVLKSDRKFALKTLKTGDSFSLDGYSVRIEKFDPWKEAAYLSVTRGGKVIGTADTLGAADLPSDFPFAFRLVAFKKAVLKRLWVDLELLQNGQTVASGSTETNHPFSWQGIEFFNTAVGRDDDRRPYAGIQIVNDPGKYTVYAGMFILCVGTIAAWYRRFTR